MWHLACKNRLNSLTTPFILYACILRATSSRTGGLQRGHSTTKLPGDVHDKELLDTMVTMHMLVTICDNLYGTDHHYTRRLLNQHTAVPLLLLPSQLQVTTFQTSSNSLTFSLKTATLTWYMGNGSGPGYPFQGLTSADKQA